MTAVHGTLAMFDSNTEEWTEYIEHLEFYFAANGITDAAKQWVVLLSCCEPSTFHLLRSLVLPSPLTDFSFADLVLKMKPHREPKPSVIVQRYQFNSRQRSPSETVAEYVAALHKLAEYCNYGESLDEMMRDRLVCGIANPMIQKWLLAEPELTLTKAVTIAQAVELADKGSKEIQLLSDKDPLRTFTSFHIHRNTKVLPQRTDRLLEFVTDVVENIIKQHVASSLKFVTFATSKAILPRCAIAKRVRTRQHLHLTVVNQPSKLHNKTYVIIHL